MYVDSSSYAGESRTGASNVISLDRLHTKRGENQKLRPEGEGGRMTQIISSNLQVRVNDSSAYQDRQLKRMWGDDGGKRM